jgi:hypothetical protein
MERNPSRIADVELQGKVARVMTTRAPNIPEVPHRAGGLMMCAYLKPGRDLDGSVLVSRFRALSPPFWRTLTGYL